MPGSVLMHVRMAAAGICSCHALFAKCVFGKVCHRPSYHRLVGCSRPSAELQQSSQPQLLSLRDRAIIQEGKGKVGRQDRSQGEIIDLVGRRASQLPDCTGLTAMSGSALAPMAFKPTWLVSPAVADPFLFHQFHVSVKSRSSGFSRGTIC